MFCVFTVFNRNRYTALKGVAYWLLSRVALLPCALCYLHMAPAVPHADAHNCRYLLTYLHDAHLLRDLQINRRQELNMTFTAIRAPGKVSLAETSKLDSSASSGRVHVPRQYSSVFADLAEAEKGTSQPVQHGT